MLVARGLAASLLAGVVACAAADRAPAAPAPSTPSTASSAPPPKPVTAGSASVSEPSPARAAARELRSPTPTTMDAKLREIGVDPTAPPPLGKLDPKTLRDVMNTFTKALGVTCSHCHEKRDFRAPTRNKAIATHMWNDFVRGLAVEGGALYCDSCHGGAAKLLDRGDEAALRASMKTSYVDHLSRADGKEHGCATCHGDPFEAKILSVRWK